MIVDMHSHSYYSDGVLSPSELIKLASSSGCDVFALTDHDTTDGINEAKLASKQYSLDFIPGVEISAMWNNSTIHVLGLGIDVNNEILQQGLKKHQDLRTVRAQQIAISLEQVGVVDAFNKANYLAKKDMLTRTHFAQMLINEKICKDMKTVFKRFLSINKPGYAKITWSPLVDVINWIHAASGLAVLAHPLRYRFTNAKIVKMVRDFTNYCGDGIEVVTGTSNSDEVQLATKLANDNNLLFSNGSDYHGWDNQRIQLGRLPELTNFNNSVYGALMKKTE